MDTGVPFGEGQATAEDPRKTTPAQNAARTSWAAVTVLFMFGLIGNMTGNTLGIVAPKLITSLHVTAGEIGDIGSTINFIGIGAALAAGWAADRWGPRAVGTVAVFLGGIMNLVVPVSSGFAGLMINRIIFSLGAGTATTTPIGNRALSSVTHPRDRGMAAAVFNFTFPVGVFILTLAGTLVTAHLGWESWFYILGGVGLFIGVLWLLATRRVAADAFAPREERLGRTEADRWRNIIRSRTLLGTALAWAFSTWSFYFLGSWLTLYFVEDRHLGYLSAGLSSVWPWVGGIIGGFAVGFLTDGLLRRTQNYRVSRVYIAAGSEVIFAVLLCLAAFSSNLTEVTVLLFFAEFFNEMAASIFQVIAIDTLAERSGSASGFIMMFCQLFGAFTQLANGNLFDAHLYTVSFLIAAIAPLLGAITLIVFVHPGKIRPWRGDDGSLTASGSQNAG